MPGSFVELNHNNYLQAFELQCSCHFVPWSEAVFSDSLTQPYFAFQLLEQGQLVGYCIGMLVVDEATLMDIGVGLNYRGKGVGRRILNHFHQVCLQKNASQIWLEVRASNQHAINLYTHYGYELIERRKGYYPTASGKEDALVMRSVLPDCTLD